MDQIHLHALANFIPDEQNVRDKYAQLTHKLIELGRTVTTMESCTSGQIASLITDTEGASAVLPGAFVTYSNRAKIREGVPAEIIDRYGVYSMETAHAMAEACREAYDTVYGIGITGTFGNADPNNDDSIPGQVYFAICTKTDSFGWECEIPSQPTRLAYKLYIANIIADHLLALL